MSFARRLPVKASPVSGRASRRTFCDWVRIPSSRSSSSRSFVRYSVVAVSCREQLNVNLNLVVVVVVMVVVVTRTTVALSSTNNNNKSIDNATRSTQR